MKPSWSAWRIHLGWGLTRGNSGRATSGRWSEPRRNSEAHGVAQTLWVLETCWNIAFPYKNVGSILIEFFMFQYVPSIVLVCVPNFISQHGSTWVNITDDRLPPDSLGTSPSPEGSPSGRCSDDSDPSDPFLNVDTGTSHTAQRSVCFPYPLVMLK